MTVDEEINKKIALAIDQINAQFDKKFKEQSDQIEAQRNEIISLKAANTSCLDAQSQWTTVVKELVNIKVAMTEGFGLLRQPDSAAHTGIRKKTIVSPVDNKLDDEELPLPLKDLDHPQSNYRTASQSPEIADLIAYDSRAGVKLKCGIFPVKYGWVFMEYGLLQRRGHAWSPDEGSDIGSDSGDNNGDPSEGKIMALIEESDPPAAPDTAA
ncbi:hypothetical protein H4Q26_011769 [Puccinia striiformis f. sp. tritici PST-130]|nr:hypothetical protein H4Q26_011769 [Puccinia striiformis f. sp. tritici PST-130]